MSFKLIIENIISTNNAAYIKSNFDEITKISKILVKEGLDSSCENPFSYFWSQSNLSKNRYSNIYPFDYNRVVLGTVCKSLPPKNPVRSIEEAESSIPFQENYLKKEFGNSRYRSSYINASWIQTPLSIIETEYIATQGPIRDSIQDFWQMVFENKSSVIVMLANIMESGHEKCAPYWPTKSNRKLEFGGDKKLSVLLLDEKPILDGSAIVREFMVFNSHVSPNDPNVKRSAIKVSHYQFTAWPDRYVPDSYDDLLDFIIFTQDSRDLAIQSSTISENTALDKQTILLPSTGPPIVHCSAGCGRTGTFVILDTIIQFFKNNDTYKGDIIQDLFYSFRFQRVHFVQTIDQLMFIYEFVYNCLFSQNPVSPMSPQSPLKPTSFSLEDSGTSGGISPNSIPENTIDP
ncbi:Receptor-type tyrosine-protein phosphatase gamma [Smittium mucronatum]|uniref:Receptor-type tyrosine-protein phosphatase gamma n=1 Tax=Smittium mucronatum TaxID=133383 RepID=A0A1R0H756_9FUNG|nr:Receptor-type tyrosine-protein phosphatase gamma [Smittium mucronatum]OLY84956.1 Receptor-type tyrosine-protein phosphatase gamma [Smittium mucronatum]